MNNATLAHAIAQAQIGARTGFTIEDVNGPGYSAPYEGVVIYVEGEEHALVHVYLNDDDGIDHTAWLVELTTPLGDADVRPLTAANLERGLQFLLSPLSL